MNPLVSNCFNSGPSSFPLTIWSLKSSYFFLVASQFLLLSTTFLAYSVINVSGLTGSFSLQIAIRLVSLIESQLVTYFANILEELRTKIVPPNLPHISGSICYHIVTAQQQPQPQQNNKTTKTLLG